LPADASAYVYIEAHDGGSYVDALVAAATQLDFDPARITAKLSVRWINEVLTEIGSPLAPIDGDALPRGLAYIDLGKSTYYGSIGVRLRLGRHVPRRGAEGEIRPCLGPEPESPAQLVVLPRRFPAHLRQVRDVNRQHGPAQLRLARRRGPDVHDAAPLRGRGLVGPGHQLLQLRRRHGISGVGIRVGAAELQRPRPHLDLPTRLCVHILLLLYAPEATGHPPALG
jgi:hypothetical protein